MSQSQINQDIVNQSSTQKQQKENQQVSPQQKQKPINIDLIDIKLVQKAKESLNSLYMPSIKEQTIQINSFHKLSSKEIEKERKITKCLWNKVKYLTQLLSIDEGGNLYIHDVSTRKVVKQIECIKNNWLLCIDVDNQNGNKIATGTMNNKILIFDINQNQAHRLKNFGQDKPQAELLGHTGSIESVQFLSSNFLIAGSSDSSVSVWDLENPHRYISLHQQHNGDISSLSIFSQDPNLFLSGSLDCTCKIWDIRIKNPVVHTFRGHNSSVKTVKFLPLHDPTTFATGSDDCTILLHDLRMMDHVGQFQDNKSRSDAVTSITFTPSGRYLLAGTEHHCVKVWDILGCGNSVSYLDVGLEEGQGSIRNIDMSADGWTLGICGTQPGQLYFAY